MSRNRAHSTAASEWLHMFGSAKRVHVMSKFCCVRQSWKKRTDAQFLGQDQRRKHHTTSCWIHEKHDRFRSASGRLVYLSADRLDIAFSVTECAPGVSEQKKKKRHKELAKKVARHLAKNRRMVWRFDHPNEPKEIHCDAGSDHGGRAHAHRNTSGGLIRQTFHSHVELDVERDQHEFRRT